MLKSAGKMEVKLSKIIAILTTFLATCSVTNAQQLLCYPPAGSFVSVSGDDRKFVAGDAPFRVAGWNSYRLVDAEVKDSKGWVANPCDPARGGPLYESRMRMQFDQATSVGLNTLRMWTWTYEEPLQPAPGWYNETVFVAMDRVLLEAAYRGVKVILCFVNNWDEIGSVSEYVKWAGVPADDEASRHAAFYGDMRVKELYKQHMKTIVSRRNVFTGQLYRDDPAIMAWNLINEPRCSDAISDQGCPQLLQSWLEEMSYDLKELDPNHLITVGEEGFFATDSPWEWSNPSQWTSGSGQDFYHNHRLPNIDFAAFHIWPSNWKASNWDMEDWIRAHVEVSTLLQKPVLLEEFGVEMKWDLYADPLTAVEADRDPTYREVYRIVEELMMSRTSLGGSLFWNLEIQDPPAADPYGVGSKPGPPADSTLAIIETHARWLN